MDGVQHIIARDKEGLLECVKSSLNGVPRVYDLDSAQGYSYIKIIK